MYFSKATQEAKVLFFIGRGEILMLRDHHRWVIDTFIARGEN
jgi:hypothetical protein